MLNYEEKQPQIEPTSFNGATTKREQFRVEYFNTATEHYMPTHHSAVWIITVMCGGGFFSLKRRLKGALSFCLVQSNSSELFR